MGSRFEERVCFRDENGGVGVDFVDASGDEGMGYITRRYSSGISISLGMEFINESTSKTSIQIY